MDLNGAETRKEHADLQRITKPQSGVDDLKGKNANGYIPPASTGNSQQLVSHDVMCILNSGDEDAHIDVIIFFADREPAGPYNVTAKASRTKHVSFN